VQSNTTGPDVRGEKSSWIHAMSGAPVRFYRRGIRVQASTAGEMGTLHQRHDPPHRRQMHPSARAAHTFASSHRDAPPAARH
jgi:hypothetical protein